MINTKLVMTSSAIVMGIIGLACVFLPDELLNYLKIEESIILPLIVQILGSLYFAFALLNWTAKANLIGGIYSRPVAMGNFIHFVMVGLALVKFFFRHPDLKIFLLPILIYIIFAYCFGKVVFISPV